MYFLTAHAKDLIVVANSLIERLMFADLLRLLPVIEFLILELKMLNEDDSSIEDITVSLEAIKNIQSKAFLLL